MNTMEGLDAIVIQARTFTTPSCPLRPILRTSQYSTPDYAAPDRSYNIQTRTKPLEEPGPDRTKPGDWIRVADSTATYDKVTRPIDR